MWKNQLKKSLLDLLKDILLLGKLSTKIWTWKNISKTHIITGFLYLSLEQAAENWRGNLPSEVFK